MEAGIETERQRKDSKSMAEYQEDQQGTAGGDDDADVSRDGLKNMKTSDSESYQGRDTQANQKPSVLTEENSKPTEILNAGETSSSSKVLKQQQSTKHLTQRAEENTSLQLH